MLASPLNSNFTIWRQEVVNSETLDWPSLLAFVEKLPYRTISALLLSGGALSCVAVSFAAADTRELRGRTAPASLPAGAPVTSRTSKAVLLGVTVFGAQAVPGERIANTYTDKLAKPVDLKDLTEIADRITELYRKEGYFLSQAVAGPQDLSSGIGRVTVYEGRISNVLVEGERADMIRPMVADLAGPSPARLSDIDERLARIRELPGLKVTSQVRPDPNDPGKHELVLVTRFDTDRVFAGLNNWGWENSGPVQAYATYVRNSLLHSRDYATFNLFTTPGDPEEFTQLGAGYNYNFLSGARLRAGLTVSLSGRGYGPGDEDPGGESVGFWARYERPLTLRRSQSAWFMAGLDVQHKENDWITGGGYRDELRVLRLGLRGHQSGNGRNTQYDVNLSKGFDVLGASGPSAWNRSRYDADAEFLKLTASLSHYRDLGRYFGIYSDVSGQWTDEPLLLSEEFAVGGSDLGRAYRYGELSGDRGLGGMVELRAGYAPDSDVISFLQGYTFYDVAAVWNTKPSGWETQDLSSAGIGVRVSLFDAVTARLEMARPLTRTPYDEDERDWRQFFQLSVSY